MTKKTPAGAEPFESNSETYWLSKLTPALRSRFAAPVRMRARQQLINDKAFMSEEQYKEEKDYLQARIDAGAYDWGPPVELNGTGPGKAIRAVLDSDEGWLRLVGLLLEETHGELPLAQVAEIVAGNPEACAAAMRAAMGLPPLAVTPPETMENPGEMTKTPEEPVPASV